MSSRGSSTPNALAIFASVVGLGSPPSDCTPSHPSLRGPQSGAKPSGEMTLM